MTAAPKFTPCPWVVCPAVDKDGAQEIASADLNGAGDYVASVYAPRDVRLIAAAPELYEALREIANSTGNSPVGDRFRSIARAALAKVSQS